MLEAFCVNIPGATIRLISISSGLATVSIAFLYTLYPSSPVLAKLYPKLFPDAKSFPIAICFAGFFPSNPPWKPRVNLLLYNALSKPTSPPVEPFVQLESKNVLFLPTAAVSDSGAK